MKKRASVVLSLVICWVCRIAIVISIGAVVYFAFNVGVFADLVKSNSGLPIRWATVQQWQWGGMLTVTMIFASIGLFGLYFLQKAFHGIAVRQPFNLKNSRNLRMFSILLLVQVFAKPVFMAIASVLLSINHSAGEKVLILKFGSQEISSLVLGLIIWVVSDLLVEANRLRSENQQFV